MKINIHKADSRGYANHGWLESYHTFSFAKYVNPERMHFGALKVLNDDTVIPGKGFVNHPHENVEIITILLQGEMQHTDSTGRQETLHAGDVQLMSAGKGMWHTLHNPSETADMKFLQIFISPDVKDTEPVYYLYPARWNSPADKFIKIASRENGESLKINQDANVYIGRLGREKSLQYNLSLKNGGVYIFVLSGSLNIFDHTLSARDGMEIEFIQKMEISASEDSYFLLIEVPME